MERKAQAAMEFLMTYGWAILAAIIAIGVLAYFGVFSPGKYLPEACTLTSPLGCADHQFLVGSVKMQIQNGAGESITISQVEVVGCTTNDNTGTGWTVADGGQQEVTMTCSSATANSKFNGAITVTYTTASGSYNHTATGTLVGQIPAA